VPNSLKERSLRDLAQVRPRHGDYAPLHLCEEAKNLVTPPEELKQLSESPRASAISRDSSRGFLNKQVDILRGECQA
jgi:hypothetical protein